MYLRYLTAKWQAQIASNPRTSFLSMWCRLNLEFPFHDSTPRVRDLPWSNILKKIRDCAERSEVRESRTVKLEPARALDPRRWPRGSQLWEREWDCMIFCTRRVQNLPATGHSDWSVDNGLLSDFFHKLINYFLSDYDTNLSSIFPGKREAWYCSFDQMANTLNPNKNWHLWSKLSYPINWYF